MGSDVCKACRSTTDVEWICPECVRRRIGQLKSRIAALEQIVTNFDAFMLALAAIEPHAGKPDSHIEALLDKVKRVSELESTERELRAAVKVLGADLRSYIMDQAVGDWTQDISDKVLANQIAAAAVREAGK